MEEGELRERLIDVERGGHGERGGGGKEKWGGSVVSHRAGFIPRHRPIIGIYGRDKQGDS